MTYNDQDKSVINIEAENLANEWVKKGFKIEILTGLEEELWQSKGHEADEIFIFLEGEVEVSFQGKTYYPKIGEEFIIPAKVPHLFTFKTFSRYYFIVEPKWYYTGDVGKSLAEGKPLSS